MGLGRLFDESVGGGHVGVGLLGLGYYYINGWVWLVD